MDQSDITASAIIGGEPPLTEIERINQMPHLEMCRLVRFAPLGHKYFTNDDELSHAFFSRYAALGGMTPEISKYLDEKHDHEASPHP